MSKKAEIAEGVKIGPYSIIGDNVVVGKNTAISNNVVVDGWTTIGEDCGIFTGAVIGAIPQDLKFRGEKTLVKIGNRNKIREYATINRGTEGGGGITSLGDGNLIMAYVHIAHDCIIGNGTVIANVATFAGHVIVDDCAIIGGLSAVHQFVRIGSYSIVGGMTKVSKDILPFMKVAGIPPKTYGLNSEGLKRRKFSDDRIATIKKLHSIIFRSKLNVTQAVEKIEEEFKGDIPADKDVAYILDFIKTSKRGITK